MSLKYIYMYKYYSRGKSDTVIMKLKKVTEL